ARFLSRRCVGADGAHHTTRIGRGIRSPGERSLEDDVGLSVPGGLRASSRRSSYEAHNCWARWCADANHTKFGGIPCSAHFAFSGAWSPSPAPPSSACSRTTPDSSSSHSLAVSGFRGCSAWLGQAGVVTVSAAAGLHTL